MRLAIRLVLLLALVLSAASVSPLALAADEPSAPASPAAPTASSSPAVPTASSSPAATTAPASSATPTAPASSATPTAPASSGTAVARRDVNPAIVTTILEAPTNPSTLGIVTFAYSVNIAHDVAAPGAGFVCSLKGPKVKVAPVACPVDAVSGPTTTGRITFGHLKGNRKAFTFKVTAVVPVGVGTPPSTVQVEGTTAVYKWHRFTTTARDSYSPKSGASFNLPLVPSRRRTNLTRIIKTIDSMPGYQQGYPGRCPSPTSGLVPGTIRISLYSLVDGAVARALVAADRRCLSVQVLMNDHLNRYSDPAWRTLEDALGTKVKVKKDRSFAHRCHKACRGGGVLHTKMYLFDSTIPNSKRNKIVHTVFFGSSNMTSNASDIQYNDLYGIRNDTTGLYTQFQTMFDLMRKDNGYHRNPPLPPAGNYQATFWPQPHGATDAYMSALRSISCKGATGGTGIDGHTVIYINMHAWFGTRGLALANKVRSLYAKGCYVRVLYSFMSYRVFRTLIGGTGGRMSVRRTIFSHNGHVAFVYSHLKNISISGNVAGDTSSKVVYTGSNNFTNEGLNFDEVAVRIKSAAAYDTYVRHFVYMRNRLSSSVYANFSEPTGGGRAPAKRSVVARAQAPDGTPTIESPSVRTTDDGRLTVLD